MAENFRTPGDLTAFLEAYGVTPPKTNTVEKWFSRGSLPTSYGYILIALLEVDRGRPISLVQYVGSNAQ